MRGEASGTGRLMLQGGSTHEPTKVERRAAALALYRAHRPALLREARLLGIDDETAEALVRAACTKVYASRSNAVGAEALFELRVAMYGAARSVRPRQHPSNNAVINTLARLSARQRQCVVLRHYAGCTEGEISRIIGCAIGSVRTHYRRGMAVFIGVLAAECQREPERV